jgi:hypothetical protein
MLACSFHARARRRMAVPLVSCQTTEAAEYAKPHPVPPTRIPGLRATPAALNSEGDQTAGRWHPMGALLSGARAHSESELRPAPDRVETSSIVGKWRAMTIARCLTEIGRLVSRASSIRNPPPRVAPWFAHAALSLRCSVSRLNTRNSIPSARRTG